MLAVMWIWENSPTDRLPKSGEITQFTVMKTNFLPLIKNFSLFSAMVLVFGLGAASAQTTNISGSLTVGPSNLVGSYSLAVGVANRATGSNSVAMGNYATASGDNSIAFGYNLDAYQDPNRGIWMWGYYATASGFASAAFNQAVSTGDYSFAANSSFITVPNGGGHSAPTANNAASLNYGAANADYSFAANGGSANNYLSAAFGCTETASPAQFVVGMYNCMVGTNEDWTTPFDWTGYSSPTNALFIVGNGNEDDYQVVASDALQVRKDGLVLINPGGDLNTGSYTNGPTP